ncbi:PTS beta-glucoside transporter subunit IIABC [Virgibacillus indicus]|uniref:PTS beta-glucoside transporter subunit IIABC n=1 Tax=Virgibacillus indicus TaxID=2024554 RepID=A0A265N876_9BACI|nr:beta-glucoside-specific PTS transporter subunit IIABC [Virgibacillus indicus]OZU88037.1 PTS beta-glucoside transporter subunit IIABC [Virgibacillus indicus]
MKYEKLSNEIIKNIGGENNVDSLYHCATRLRFKLKDEDKVNMDKMNDMEGVVTTVKSGGQVQVVIGQHVGDVYKDIMATTSLQNKKIPDGPEDSNEKNGMLNNFIDVISGVFTPLLGILTATGVIKGLLALINTFGWLPPESGTVQILTIVGDCFFYFFPVFLGYTAMKKFGGTPFIGMAIGAAIIHPNLLGLTSGEPLYTLFSGTVFESEVFIEFFGIPVILVSYVSSVIPIIISSYFAAKLEKFLDKRISSLIKAFGLPMLVLLVIIPLTFLVIGPISTWLSQLLGLAASEIYNLNATIFGFLYGALIQVFVMFGLHWGFVAISINNISTLGFDPVTITGLTAGFGQAGAVLMAIKQLNSDKIKAIGYPAFISSLFGITEPAIYGVTLKLKRPFIIGCIATGIGGAIMGFAGAKQYAFGANGIFGFLNVINPDTGADFSVYATIIACLVSFVVAVILMHFFGLKKDAVFEAGEAATEAIAKNDETKLKEVFEMTTPLEGEMIPLEAIDDPVFSSGAMGKGICVEPTIGEIVAPFDGKVATMFPTKHAIGLVSDDGVEVLIHIGIDTVQLEGKYFNVHIEADAAVKKGDKLITFDVQGIKDEGYRVTTPVIITNTDEYLDVIPAESRHVVLGDKLLNIVK